jgi:hypothetical protein
LGDDLTRWNEIFEAGIGASSFGEAAAATPPALTDAVKKMLSGTVLHSVRTMCARCVHNVCTMGALHNVARWAIVHDAQLCTMGVVWRGRTARAPPQLHAAQVRLMWAAQVRLLL